MLFKVCVAALSIAVVAAEPPVNNGYLPPPTSPPGYNYPKPPNPTQPPYRPPPPQPPTYRPPPPPPPPSYGPPVPPPQPPRPTYGPPVPPPQPPRPTYGPPVPPPQPPRPTYGPPVPPPQPPRPTYGTPTQTDTQYKPVPIPPNGNGVNGPYRDPPVDGGHDHDHGDHHHHEPGMPFDFNYAVKDDYYGTDYSHNAVSDGDVVRGEYKVLLPDGRLQIVTYTADWKNGFNADIKYQGEPSYPAPAPTNQNRPVGPTGGQYQTPGQQGGSGPY